MKKILKDIQWIILFLIIWIILFEEISLKIIISGILISVVALLFTEKMLVGGSFYKEYPINIFWLIKYGLFLVIEIYKAGFITIYKTITGKINPGTVDIKTNLKDDYSISILANSITLTPGTVTLNKNGNHLKVLWLDVETKNSKKAGKIIKGNLEKRFEKREAQILRNLGDE